VIEQPATPEERLQLPDEWQSRVGIVDADLICAQLTAWRTSCCASPTTTTAHRGSAAITPRERSSRPDRRDVRVVGPDSCPRVG
jgi:hypothetical protein